MRHQRRRTTCRFLFATLVALGSAPAAFADVVAFSGVISQSSQDSGNPAQNNPALNSILSGGIYKVILDFNGSIHSPGPKQTSNCEIHAFSPSPARRVS